MMLCFCQADIGVTPFVLQDTMASMLEHAKAWPTEYDDVPFLQVGGHTCDCALFACSTCLTNLLSLCFPNL